MDHYLAMGAHNIQWQEDQYQSDTEEWKERLIAEQGAQ